MNMQGQCSLQAPILPLFQVNQQRRKNREQNMFWRIELAQVQGPSPMVEEIIIAQKHICRYSGILHLMTPDLSPDLSALFR